MTGNTTYEGYPYPLETDFADVQDAFRLATAVDADLRAAQAPFRSFLSRPSFIALQSSTQSGVIAGSEILQTQTIEWDNAGMLTAGGTVWKQPLSQPPSWWLFGATVRVSPTGTPTAGDLNLAQIVVQTTDVVTGVLTTTNFWHRIDDTVTGGDWMNVFGMAPVYHGQAFVRAWFDGSVAKGILAGSRFWGLYLGPVT